MTDEDFKRGYLLGRVHMCEILLKQCRFGAVRRETIERERELELEVVRDQDG